MDRASAPAVVRRSDYAASSPKRLNVFERYLSLWVGLCMVVGVVLGLTAPGMMQWLREPGVRRRQPDQRADCDPHLADDHADDDEGRLRI